MAIVSLVMIPLLSFPFAIAVALGNAIGYTYLTLISPLGREDRKALPPSESD
jgi:hypothetical protein